MKTRSAKRTVSGWIILDKPLGMTSTQAVGKVRWLYGAAKAGHAGTLDPLATGILPIALGEATKTVPFVQGGTKSYLFELAWGTATTTDDAEGEPVATSEIRPSEAAVHGIVPRFVGTILQRPPVFSALKIDGERAYDLARAGAAVELAPREVTISSLVLISHGPDRSRFELTCEKGTYVRSLARDIAEALGTRGHVSLLRRTTVGPFDLGTALTIEAIEASESRDALLHPPAIALAGLPEFRLTPEETARIRTGASVLLRGSDAPISAPEAWVSLAGQAVAIGHVEAGHFNPTRVLLG